MVQTTLNEWDFEQFHVQRELDTKDFVNAASTLIAAGPPTLAQGSNAISGGQVEDPLTFDELRPDSSDFAYPIGVLENAAINQNRVLQRIFEIGSKRSYFVVGRNMGSLTLARTLVHGASLLRVLYAYYPNILINETVGRLLTGDFPDAEQVKNNPGFADFFINLDSDLFDRPLGLMLFFRDSRNQPYGAVYLEDCYINTHQINVASQSVLVLENTMIQFDRAVPINVGAIAQSDRAFENR
jgi:hypothetical protein